MNIEIRTWMRGAVRIGTVLTVLVALMAVPVWAYEAEELEGSAAEPVAYSIDPQDFVGTATVLERVAANRVFDDTAFDTSDEETFIDAETVNPALRPETTPSFQEAAQQAGQAAGTKPDTGNDPRDFSGKVMPYYRFNKLSNGMETSDFTMFAFWAWSKVWGMTWEIPLARRYDITGTEACAGLEQGTPCFGDVGGGGTPEFPLGFPYEGDGVEVGLGDSIFRLMMNTKKNFFGSPLILGVDMNFPTATKDVLGSETFTIGPIFTFVWDFPVWPAPGSFFAMMNIFQIDAWKDSSRGDVNRFIGRWFLQLPVQKSQKLYIMIEMQPVYDFETEHFSFWIAPEFGKAFSPDNFFQNGGALYFKPGVGISPKAEFGDRDWSFELGFRYFLPPFKTAIELMALAGR